MLHCHSECEDLLHCSVSNSWCDDDVTDLILCQCGTPDEQLKKFCPSSHPFLSWTALHNLRQLGVGSPLTRKSLSFYLGTYSRFYLPPVTCSFFPPLALLSFPATPSHTYCCCVIVQLRTSNFKGAKSVQGKCFSRLLQKATTSQWHWHGKVQTEKGSRKPSWDLRSLCFGIWGQGERVFWCVILKRNETGVL